jgi:hypothetical protein
LLDTAGDYTVRTYLPGDEAAIVLLFNVENANSAGFVPRTVEYWRWCCFERPDVDAAGIIIVEKRGETVGYSVVGRSGNVYELCVDSHYDKRRIFSILLSRVEEYARSVGGNSVVLNVSTEDTYLRSVCQKLDFAESPPEPVFLNVLDLPKLICDILQSRELPFQKSETFWFNLKNCPPWCISSFGIKIEKQRVTVINETSPGSRVTFESELQTMVSFIFGTQSTLRTLASSKILFSPFWRLSTARKLLNLLRIKTPWFIPRADMA